MEVCAQPCGAAVRSWLFAMGAVLGAGAPRTVLCQILPAASHLYLCTFSASLTSYEFPPATTLAGGARISARLPGTTHATARI